MVSLNRWPDVPVLLPLQRFGNRTFWQCQGACSPSRQGTSNAWFIQTDSETPHWGELELYQADPSSRVKPAWRAMHASISLLGARNANKPQASSYRCRPQVSNHASFYVPGVDVQRHKLQHNMGSVVRTTTWSPLVVIFGILGSCGPCFTNFHVSSGETSSQPGGSCHGQEDRCTGLRTSRRVSAQS